MAVNLARRGDKIAMEAVTGFTVALFDGRTWLIQLLLLLFSALLASHLARRLLDALAEKLNANTRNLWDDALIASARRPLLATIWLLALSWGLELLFSRAAEVEASLVAPLREAGVIALLTWFLLRFIVAGEAVFLSQASANNSESRLDESTAHALAKLLRLIVVIAAALILLQSFGYSVAGVLAFGGIGGIAIGFAARDLLANFFGGLMIYLDRPFVIGDWIRSPDQEIEGTVEYIGWRLTRIRTFDKRPLYIPNATFTQISVENPSRMTHRRIYETVGLRYNDAAVLAEVVAEVERMLRQHDEIASDQTLMVNVNSFGESSLDFFIYCFTVTTDWQHFHIIKQDVLLKILAIVDQHGAEVAFPTRVVELATVDAN